MTPKLRLHLHPTCRTSRPALNRPPALLPRPPPLHRHRMALPCGLPKAPACSLWQRRGAQHTLQPAAGTCCSHRCLQVTWLLQGLLLRCLQEAVACLVSAHCPLATSAGSSCGTRILACSAAALQSSHTQRQHLLGFSGEPCIPLNVWLPGAVLNHAACTQAWQGAQRRPWCWGGQRPGQGGTFSVRGRETRTAILGPESLRHAACQPEQPW